jgi:hypothetical protein
VNDNLAETKPLLAKEVLITCTRLYVPGNIVHGPYNGLAFKQQEKIKPYSPFSFEQQGPKGRN